MLKLVPSQDWAVAYLKAAILAAQSLDTSDSTAIRRPAPPLLTTREVADLLSGAAHCIAPWQEILRAKAASEELADKESSIHHEPASNLQPREDISSSATGTWTPLIYTRDGKTSAYDSDFISHEFGKFTPPLISDEISSDLSEIDEDSLSLIGANDLTPSNKDVAPLLSLAPQLAESSEALLLTLARRMSASDLSRALDAHWRLGRPAGAPLLRLVQSRGVELIRNCTPYQATLILQAMAYSSYHPSALWVQTFLSYSGHRLVKEYSPLLLVQTLRSMARLEIKPGWEWISAWLEAAATQLQLCNTSLCSQVGVSSGSNPYPLYFPYDPLPLFSVDHVWIHT